jgi:hypothetical protein
VAGLTVEEASAAAADLRRVGILQRRGALAFIHPVVRAAVAASLDEAERERGHARAAELLCDAGRDAGGDRGPPAPRGARNDGTGVRDPARRRPPGAGARRRGLRDRLPGAGAARAPGRRGRGGGAVRARRGRGALQRRGGRGPSAAGLRALARALPPRRDGDRAGPHALWPRALRGRRGGPRRRDRQLSEPGLLQWLEAEAISLSRFVPDLYRRARVRLSALEGRFDPDAPAAASCWRSWRPTRRGAGPPPRRPCAWRHVRSRAAS